MYNDYWWIDSGFYPLEVQSWEIQYSTAFREIDGSIIDVPEESSWDSSSACWADIFRNNFIFHGGWADETTLQIGKWTFPSKDINLNIFLWIVMLFRGLDIETLSILAQKTEIEILQEVLREIPLILPNMTDSAIEHLAHSTYI